MKAIGKRLFAWSKKAGWVLIKCVVYGVLKNYVIKNILGRLIFVSYLFQFFSFWFQGRSCMPKF